jgi:hypothetical protein
MSDLAQAQGITLAQLAGNWAGEGNATFSFCWNSNYSALVDCKGAPNLVRYIDAIVFQGTSDTKGNSCNTVRHIFSPQFPNPVTPAVVVTHITTQKNISYDSTSESGTASFKSYDDRPGTLCMGSVLVNTVKAPATSNGTLSFVVSQKGTRIDSVTDTVVDTPISSLGDYAGNTVAFEQ